MDERVLRKRNVEVQFKTTARKPSVKSAVKPSVLQSSIKHPTSTPHLPSSTTVQTSLSKRASIPPNTSNSLANTAYLTKPAVKSRLSIAHSTKPTEEKNNQLSTIETTVEQLKVDNDQLRLTIDSLKSDLEGVQLVVAVLSDLKIKVRDTEIVCKRVSDENTDLKVEISALKAQLVNQSQQQSQLSETPQQEIDEKRIVSTEQQEVNSNIIIRGVELTSDSDTEPSRIYNSIRSHFGIADDEAFNPLSVNLVPTSTAKQSSNTRIIQVRLRSSTAKKQFLQIRRRKKDITLTEIGLCQSSKKSILITEQLTRSNQELLYAARSLRETHKFKFVWSSDGQILVRSRQGAKVTRISDIYQVNEFRSQINLPPFGINLEPTEHHTQS